MGEEIGARIWRNMVVIAKSKNVNSDFGGQLGRRGLVIFVINVISSALILLISSGGGGGVVVVAAQHNGLPQPPLVPSQPMDSSEDRETSKLVVVTTALS